MTVTLRPVSAADEEFLFSVYASTRAEEMERIDWPSAQKQAFLRMQFRVQDRSYRENYADAEFSIILRDDQPIGRFYVQRREEEIRIMDIALLPACQKMGIGSSLMNEILEEGARRNLPVTIHVERFNPALTLYERLGFRLVEERGIHYFMKWLPPTLATYEDTRAVARQ